MNMFFVICMFVAMAAVLGALGMGIYSMTRGGEFNKQHGNKLMQARVTLQGIALLMFALAVLSSQG